MKKGVDSIGFVRGCNILLPLIFLLFMASSVAADSQDDGWTGNVNAYLGSRAHDGDEGFVTEGQRLISIRIDFRPRSWPVNIAIDLLGVGVGDSGTETEIKTYELNAGIRKIWERFVYTRPFIGGGLSYIRREFGTEAFGNEYLDQGTGLWFEGGVYWTLAGHFNIGMKMFSSDITLFGNDTHTLKGRIEILIIGILIGGHW
ncbi:MAG: hypothetical protein JSU92_05725 [Deltaproteobacteria bacterium]|nr:MAG: hypothetical protein JSU92_05725 [Deltaproteobacteria bacterium]